MITTYILMADMGSLQAASTQSLREPGTRTILEIELGQTRPIRVFAWREAQALGERSTVSGLAVVSFQGVDAGGKLDSL
jgi:hypothetical protein